MIKSKNVAKLLLVVGILCSILGVSYALFIKNLSGTNNNSLTATCFNVTFTDQNNIGLTNTYPLLDEEGKKLTPYEFTVTNNCDTFVKYDINLEILNTSTLTNMDYIKLMLDDGTPALVSKYDVTTKTLSNASTAYKIKSDLYLDAKESKTYKLRLWLDENVTTETEGVQNKSFASKITVNASYTEKIPTAVDNIVELAKSDTTNLAIDDYGNTRYIGKSPNNYVRVEGEEYPNDVYFGYYSTTSTSYKEYSSLDECTKDKYYNYNCKVGITKGTPILWRIIGVMNDIDDGTGNKNNRLKLIRSESIGEYVWDSSDSSINNGRGINEWSQADIMKLLNPGYEDEENGGSLYWNNKSGMCYLGWENETTSCDFTSKGIKDNLKNLIDNAVWNTGANDGTSYTYENMNTSKFYELERSNNTGKICSNGTYCNDAIARTTTWTGKVGLMYPSDYGYATSGGSTVDRITCINGNLNYWLGWDQNILQGCAANDWLYNDEEKWTMVPANKGTDDATQVFLIHDCVSSSYAGNVTFDCKAIGGGRFSSQNSKDANAYPVVYLKPSVKIVSGTGSESDPFVLGL